MNGSDEVLSDAVSTIGSSTEHAIDDSHEIVYSTTVGHVVTLRLILGTDDTPVPVTASTVTSDS